MNIGCLLFKLPTNMKDAGFFEMEETLAGINSESQKKRIEYIFE
jgi:hypothetical protein